MSDGPAHDEEHPHIGKNNNGDISQEPLIANEGTNGSMNCPNDLEMKDGHLDDTRAEVARDDRITEIVPASSILNHEITADDTSKDNDDDNGEDIVEEAAEDTVIY